MVKPVNPTTINKNIGTSVIDTKLNTNIAPMINISMIIIKIRKKVD